MPIFGIVKNTTKCLSPESLSAADSSALKVTIIYEDFARGARAKHFAEELAERLGSPCPLTECMWRFDLLEYPQIADDAGRAVAESDYLIVALHRERILPLATRAWLGVQIGAAAREDTGLSVVLLNFGGSTAGWRIRGDARPYLLTICAENGVPFFCHAEGHAVDELVAMLGRPSVSERPPHYATAGLCSQLQAASL